MWNDFKPPPYTPTISELGGKLSNATLGAALSAMRLPKHEDPTGLALQLLLCRRWGKS